MAEKKENAPDADVIAQQAARIRELEAQMAATNEKASQVEAENKTLARWKQFGHEVPPELEDMVKEKVEAGLSLEQAITVAKAQFLHDAGFTTKARKG